MALEIVSPPNITTGDPYSPEFTVTINDVAVTSATVKVAIVDKLHTKTFAGPVTASYSAGKWSATFTKEQTAALLVTPADLTSKLAPELLKQIDATTGYAIAHLEVQIGSPYAETTRHAIVTVGKGLVP